MALTHYKSNVIIITERTNIVNDLEVISLQPEVNEHDVPFCELYFIVL